MPHTFKLSRVVEFVDTDMAGIVHFSNFFRYMEATEHAFFRSFGQRLHEQRPDGSMSGFARVQVACDYQGPLRYLDEVEVQLLVKRRGTRSLSYAFVFRKIKDRGEPCPAEEVAHGSMTVVCVARRPEEEKLQPVALDPELAAQIQEAPRELLPEKP